MLYVKGFISCQSVKSAHTTAIGNHCEAPSNRLMDGIFIGFMGPLNLNQETYPYWWFQRAAFRRRWFVTGQKGITVLLWESRLDCVGKGQSASVETISRTGHEAINTNSYYTQSCLVELVCDNHIQALNVFHYESLKFWYQESAVGDSAV